MQNLYNELAKILEKDERIFADGKIIKNKISELAFKLDKDLLDLLLKNKQMKDHFFVEVDKALIFDQDKFIKFINNKEFLPDSFTTFKNRIGLTENDEYIKDNGKVVLAWGYKDCVLEGGQNKEDTKRDEIFYNEIIAPDEIDRLFEPKVLTNFKKYDKSGEHKVDSITEQDNLIIKGNNLLALHSIEKYTGKIKLIYIDPPYNTGGDANIFTYNNTFNHSTWLTFINNRLEVAKKMLKEDGFIAIAIDHFELGYLLVLADEIFGRENRLGIISVVNNPMGRNQAKYFSTINDYMIVYAKDQSRANFNNVILNEEFYKTFDKEDSKGKYKLNNFIRVGGGDANLRVNKKSFWYPIYVKSDLSDISLEEKTGYIKVLPITAGKQERTWKLSKKSTEDILYDLVAKKEDGKIIIYEKYRIEKGQKVSTIWADKKYNANHQGIRLLEDILGNKNFSYPKSLYTIIDTLKIMTTGNDIIMDFFAGSGTTGHATLELNKIDKGNRKFILIEQLNEHIEICKERIVKILPEKESFIYFELKEWNEEYMQKIQEAKTPKELVDIYKKIQKEAFFRYDIDLSKFDEKDFGKLELKDQKQVLMQCLDKNHLYVNYSEIDDSTYKVSAEDKKINKQFYGK